MLFLGKISKGPLNNRHIYNTAVASCQLAGEMREGRLLEETLTMDMEV